MIKGKKVGVVVPAYNEQDFIANTIAEIPESIDIIVCVDDRSNDNTHSVMVDLSTKDKRIIVLQTDKNGGIGHSVKTGIAHILEMVDYICVLPGDNQCDATLIPEFVNNCEENGLQSVKGNRLMKGNDTSAMPKIRMIGNMAYSLLTKIVSGYYTIFDSQHGFCVIQAKTLKETTVEKIRNDYLFDNSLWVVLNTANARVGEMMSPVRYQGEISNIDYFTFIKASVGYFAKAYFWRISKRYGSLNIIFMLIFLGPIAILWSIFSKNIIFALWGCSFFCWAMFFDYWNDPNKVSDRRRVS